MQSPRVILHLDMDAFFAAVEQRDNPAFRGKPVIVGGIGGRGVVSTASYEARKFGCRSAMPMAQAIRLCPEAIVLPPRMQAYSVVSHQVFEILERFTPLVEPLSVDEAFLDVTGSQRLFGDGETIAREIRRLVRETTQLTASVGVAPSKFIAKLASDSKKPDGLVIVPPDQTLAFLDPLPISRLWGVGPATLPKFDQLGVRTFGDLRRTDAARVRSVLGESGDHFLALVSGEDDRDVVPDREAKSISHETTFAEDVADREYLRATLLEQIDQVAARLRRHERLARVVMMKIRTPDFSTYTRRTTLEAATDVTDHLWRPLAELFDLWIRERRSRVRLIGAGVTNLVDRVGQQLTLFEQADATKRRQLDATVDAIRSRFGKAAIVRGANAEIAEDSDRE